MCGQSWRVVPGYGLLTKSEVVRVEQAAEGGNRRCMPDPRIPRMNDTACPYCGAVWSIVLTPVNYAAPNVAHYRGACTCGHPLKDLEALGHVASLFRMIKPSTSSEGPDEV